MLRRKLITLSRELLLPGTLYLYHPLLQVFLQIFTHHGLFSDMLIIKTRCRVQERAPKHLRIREHTCYFTKHFRCTITQLLHMLLVLHSHNANKQRVVAVNIEAKMTLTVPIVNEEPISIPQIVSSIQLSCIYVSWNILRLSAFTTMRLDNYILTNFLKMVHGNFNATSKDLPESFFWVN